VVGLSPRNRLHVGFRKNARVTGTRVKIQYRGVVSEIYQTNMKIAKIGKHVTTADPTRPDRVDKSRSHLSKFDKLVTLLSLFTI